jgi:hypothetical protein
MRDDTFKLGDVDSITGDTLEAWARNGTLYLSIENPWAGDTESGFGATTAVSLSKDDAVKFANWILSKFA